jgi:hypothetical protein
MRRLARSMPPKTLAANGYALYVKFRPGGPPQSNVDLMTEKQVLSFKPAPRLEHGGEEHSGRTQD